MKEAYLYNSREIALKILYEIDVNQSYSNISLKHHLNKYPVLPKDKSLITQLVYGIIKNKTRIDWIIAQFSHTPIKKMTPWVHNILRLGIYQIIFLDKIPDSAAVNESVKLGRQYGHKKITGFINGILRNVARAQEEHLYPDRKNTIDYLSIVYSHPKWMVEKWIRAFGMDFTIDLMAKNNGVPPITIRTNTLKTTREALMQLLEQEGMDVKEGPWCPEAIILQNTSNIERSHCFQQGLFQVQDQSSMLVAHILNPPKDGLILDLCAAPGGKSTHIAQRMDNTGLIIARDIHDHKLRLMKDSIERLGITNIKLENHDAFKKDIGLYGKADKVLLDAPCSGLGIIRRKPDLKWNKDKEDVKSITRLQIRMLENASHYLKVGGTLVYSTCTINPEENLEVVKQFLNGYPHFKLIPIQPVSQKMASHKETHLGYLQIYPNIDDIDGFFISKIYRER